MESRVAASRKVLVRTGRKEQLATGRLGVAFPVDGTGCVRALAGGLPSRTRVITPVRLDSGLTLGAHHASNLGASTHSLGTLEGTERELECECELSGQRDVMVHMLQHQSDSYVWMMRGA